MTRANFTLQNAYEITNSWIARVKFNNKEVKTYLENINSNLKSAQCYSIDFDTEDSYFIFLVKADFIPKEI